MSILPTTALIVRRTPEALDEQVKIWKSEGLKIGLVPTMGALHHGHLGLIEQIAQKVDRVIVSIFVNPSQFGPQEDFNKYPRPEAEDLKALTQSAADIAYLPSLAGIYPAGFDSKINPGKIAKSFEGAVRPGHFEGVATIVMKLFMQSQADVAIFGEKDYQQLCVIRQLVRDFDLKINIMAAPTAREPDGLAASSRNRYLTPEKRQIAGQLNKILKQACAKAQTSLNKPIPNPSPSSSPNIADIAGMPVNHPLSPAQQIALKQIAQQANEAVLKAGFEQVDYLDFVDAETLASPHNKAIRLLAVARLDGVRLLDNMAL